MLSPFVSIIIPTYNRRHLLPRAVGSVISQTFTDFELIVVDDSSLDDTVALIEGLSAIDNRIKCISNIYSKGPSGARNTGIEKALGRYIAFLDSDDEWMNFHLEKMVTFIEEHKDDVDILTANPLRKNMITGDIFKEDEIDLSKYDFIRIEDAYIFNPKTLFSIAVNNRIITTQTMVSKTEILRNIHFDEELVWGEDNMFMLEIAYSRPRVGHFQDYHVVYWGHEGNLTDCLNIKNQNDKEKANLGIALFYEKALKRFESNITGYNYLRKNAADHFFWSLGYNTYLRNGYRLKAIQYFLRAIRLEPLVLRYWKTFIFRCLLLGRAGLS